MNKNTNKEKIEEYQNTISRNLEDNATLNEIIKIIYDVYKKEDTKLNYAIKKYGLFAECDYDIIEREAYMTIGNFAKPKSADTLIIELYSGQNENMLYINEDKKDVSTNTKEEIENIILDVLSKYKINDQGIDFKIKNKTWETVLFVVTFIFSSIGLLTILILFLTNVCDKEVLITWAGIPLLFFILSGLGIYSSIRESLEHNNGVFTYTPLFGFKKKCIASEVKCIEITSIGNRNIKRVSFLDDNEQVLLSFMDSYTVIGNPNFYKALAFYDISIERY